jgi:hypothetical protein
MIEEGFALDNPNDPNDLYQSSAVILNYLRDDKFNNKELFGRVDVRHLQRHPAMILLTFLNNEQMLGIDLRIFQDLDAFLLIVSIVTIAKMFFVLVKGGNLM